MRDIFDQMPHVIDAQQMLVNLLRHKGIYVAMPPLGVGKSVSSPSSRYYGQMPQASPIMHNVKTGTPIWAFDKGKTYFMPVWLRPSGKGKIEIPVATISIKGKKTIVETLLVGRNGSVKELIAIDDYDIEIDGVVMSQDRNYPEDGVQQIAELFQLNESVELICAVSDIVVGTGSQIVIKSIEWPKVGGVDNMQAFSLTAVTDASVELEIK